jgi:uncharacterized Ntn-hydrolase superfamily protein
MLRRLSLSVATLLLAVAPLTSAPPGSGRRVATFSIVAFDPETGDLGVAVESRFFAVGAVVPWAKAGVGAIATQSLANTTFGPKGLQLLESGIPAQEALDRLLKEDRQPEQRQVGMVDARGGAATWTGEKCNPWAGGRKKKNYTVQGNILAGPQVVEALASGFEASSGLPLADRLVKALAAGQAAGGDSRGQQSAALLVVREKGGYAGYNDRYIDLRVDDHPHPIDELARLLEMHHDTNAYADARFFVERGDKDRGTRIMEESTLRRVSKAGGNAADQGNAYYDLACFYSQMKMPDPALSNLEKAFRLNPALLPTSMNDTDLDPLRNDSRFKALVKNANPPKD